MKYFFAYKKGEERQVENFTNKPDKIKLITYRGTLNP